MKLIDVVKLIPESTEFMVEEYADPNDPDSMTYAWWIRPFSKKDREDLKCVYNNEVIGLRTGYHETCETDCWLTLAVEIQR